MVAPARDARRVLQETGIEAGKAAAESTRRNETSELF
jgi:hypothetical protein